jgi:hypothetical protein
MAELGFNMQAPRSKKGSTRVANRRTLVRSPAHQGSGRCSCSTTLTSKFLAKFKTALEALKPGDPMDEKTTHGPLSTEGALVQLLKQVDAAVKDGAKLLMGGKRIDRLGLFMGIQEFVNKKLVRTGHFPAPT